MDSKLFRISKTLFLAIGVVCFINGPVYALTPAGETVPNNAYISYQIKSPDVHYETSNTVIDTVNTLFSPNITPSLVSDSVFMLLMTQCSGSHRSGE